MSTDVQPPTPSGPRRGPVRRYLEARGLVGRYRASHLDTRLVASDGTRLAATYLGGSSGAQTDAEVVDAEVAVLLLHGFAANRRKPAYARLADRLSSRVPVLALDLRGHGGSSGWCTLGDREVADVLAGIAWLQRFGHPRVVVMGWSMGATAALHAAWRGAAIEALVTVSAPARFRDPAETLATQRLETLWHSPVQRRALRTLLGVSLGPPSAWSSPPDPVQMVASIDRPLLIVHGRDDGYFPVDDARALAAAAGGDVSCGSSPRASGMPRTVSRHPSSTPWGARSSRWQRRAGSPPGTRPAGGDHGDVRRPGHADRAVGRTTLPEFARFTLSSAGGGTIAGDHPRSTSVTDRRPPRTRRRPAPPPELEHRDRDHRPTSCAVDNRRRGDRACVGSSDEGRDLPPPAH